MKQRAEHRGWDQDSETETKEKKIPEAKAVTHEDEKKIILKRLWGWEGKKIWEWERFRERRELKWGESERQWDRKVWESESGVYRILGLRHFSF